MEIKNIYGSVIFTTEKENLIGADLEDADLEGADLIGADLRGADLRGANLRDADLRDTDLRGANLRDANLECANLRDANLECANLRDANLECANLEDANLPVFCKWGVSFKNESIKIGCKEKTIEQWNFFFNSNEEIDTERGTEEFARIEATFKAYKAYKKHMDEFKTK